MNTSFSENFTKVISLIDAVNASDPRLENREGKQQPKELLYSQRMTNMLNRFDPKASEAVQIACRAQHIERWLSPREAYPMTREGYFKWRTELYKFHADKTGELMKQAGYDDVLIERVKTIVGKKNIKTNPDSQTLEDIAGLVFIEHYMQDFVNQKPDYTEEKWIGIIQKTWNKMSLKAHSFALSGQLKLPETLVPVILKAIKQ